LQGGDGGGVVDENAGFRKHTEGVHHILGFRVAQPGGTQFLGIDLGFLGDHALNELLSGHFECEEGDIAFERQTDMLGDADHEAGLAHARATRDDDQV